MKQVISLLIISLIWVQFSCTTSANSGELVSTEVQEIGIARDVEAVEFNKFIQNKENALILDVRTEGEVTQGFIEGAVNIDFNSSGFKTELNKLNKSQPILVYCRSGRRSASTMSYLKENGFTEVYNLSGGILSWQQAGLKVNN